MGEDGEFLVAVAGISCLQLPAVVSSAQKGSFLSELQICGFPLNMSQGFLRRHFSFSPGNMKEGRYYTMVTSLFHHSEPSHLATNLVLLASSGRTVHARFGRKRFLYAFFGGGITGNLAMWLHYLLDRERLHDSFPKPTDWALVGNTVIGQSLETGKRHILSSTFDSVNYWLSCIGCSACVSAILSIETCIMLETLVTRLRRVFGRNSIGRVDERAEEDFELSYDLLRIFLTCTFVWNDLQALFGGSKGGGSFFAHSFSSVGHSGHLGGFVFGLVYYFFIRR